MNWKKAFLIALVVFGFGFAAAPRSEAHTRFSIGIGLGVPVVYPAYPVAYYPRPYYGHYYRAPVVGVRYHWVNGRRVYYGRHCRRW